ncbi:MAG TPA: hypothetical protein VF006_25605 [Longimicrobium sp.]
MNDPHIDQERLGALLEGNMPPRERAALLARLAASEAELEAYADALAVTDELEAEDGLADAADEALEEADGGARVIPLRAPRRRGWGAGPRLALAASLAAVAIGAAAWGLGRGTGQPADPGRFAALLGRPGIPAGWNATPWTASRTPDETLDPHARAVRIGARITDLEAAAAAGDSTAARAAAAEAGALLEPLAAGGPAAALYGELGRRAGEPAGALAPLRERGRRTAARLAGEDGVALGAWAEAARLAAARRDAEFFRARATRRALERAAADPALPASARGGVERIRAALAAASAPDWGAVEREAARILADAGT